jgi:hypothetical protein
MESSVYVIWNVFFFLELLGVKLIVQPEFRTVRFFLAFCALRDVVLFTVGGHTQAYWDIGWTSKQIEMVWLAWIAGHISSLSAGRFEWPMRVPSIGVAALSILNLPFWAAPEQMHTYQWHCQIIIIGTVLIGCVLTVERRHLRIAASVAILAASGLVSAATFLAGHYAPTVATLTWIIGLSALLAALKGNPEICGKRLSRFAASVGGQAQPPSEPTSESTPKSESSPLQEWTAWPCHTQVQ